MLKVAVGIENRDDLLDHLEDLIEEDEFAHSFAGEKPTMEEAVALLDEIIDAHNQVVPEISSDLVAYRESLAILNEQGIVPSLDGFDAGEGAEEGHQLALDRATSGQPTLGYLYSHRQDFERAVYDGELWVGFSHLSAEKDDTAAVGRIVADTFIAAGLPVHWDGNPGERIRIAPFRWEEPFGIDEVDTEPSESIIRLLHAKSGGQLDADRVGEPVSPELARTSHRTKSGAYPPDDNETFSGSLALTVAINVADQTAIHHFIEEMIEGNHFAEAYENATAPTVTEAKELLSEVIAEHDRQVSKPSRELILFFASVAVLASRGVALTLDQFDDEFCNDEGVERALVAEEQTGAEARGYVYCTHMDLRRAVLHGELRVGFGAMIDVAEDSMSVGHLASEVFQRFGLSLSEPLPAPYGRTGPSESEEPWIGDPGERIVLRPFHWETPFADNENGTKNDALVDRAVTLTDRYGASSEGDVSFDAFAVMFYSLLDDDSDKEHCVVDISDSQGWNLEFTDRSVRFDRIDPDDIGGTHVFTDPAEALTIAADFIGGDLESVHHVPWVRD